MKQQRKKGQMPTEGMEPVNGNNEMQKKGSKMTV